LIGRRRITAGWLLVGIGVVTASVWGVSRWWSVSYTGSSWSVNVAGGCANCTWDWMNNRWPSGWHAADRTDVYPKLSYWYGFDARETRMPNSVYCYGLVRYWPLPGMFKVLSIAWWPLPALMWGAGAVLMRWGVVARRRAGEVCKGCSYSLVGLPDGANCPECGEISRRDTRRSADAEGGIN
jgi:hypothetical protein